MQILTGELLVFATQLEGRCFNFNLDAIRVCRNMVYWYLTDYDMFGEKGMRSSSLSSIDNVFAEYQSFLLFCRITVAPPPWAVCKAAKDLNFLIPKLSDCK